MSPETFDIWLPRVMRLVAAIAGVLIMGFETVLDHSDRPWIYAAAIAMMGLPVAQAGERLLGKISAGSPGSTNPPGLAPPPDGQQPVLRPVEGERPGSGSVNGQQ